MNAEQNNKKYTESEQLSADEQKVVQLLGGLRRAQAPGDFEFHVKARIAQGNPGAPAPLFGRFRYFAPLAVVLMVAGYIGFSEIMSPRVNNGITVAGTSRSEPSSGNVQQRNVAANPELEVPAPVPAADIPTMRGNEEIASAGHYRKSNRRPSLKFENTGGSKTDAGRAFKKIINPPGINPAPVNTNQNASETEGITKTGVRDLLSMLGIDAESAAKGWKVRSSKANSAAERAGVRADDVIEAIDDRQIDANSVFTGNFAVKSLKILREGKSLTIALQNK